MSLISRLAGRRRAPAAPVRAALELAKGENVLATARDEHTGDLLVATSGRVASVADDETPAPTVRISRGWHEVDAGSWEPETATISVTWVDGRRASQWSLVGGGSAFSQVFYERVAASVLLDAPLEVPEGDDEGLRRVGRVALRRDLTSGNVVKQVVWARGVRRDDPDLAEFADTVLADLAEQVGLR